MGICLDPNKSNNNWVKRLVGEEPVPGRRIGTSRYSITGFVSTRKAESAQPTESSLEHDFFTLLRFDRGVEAFMAQPFTIRWRDPEGKTRRYTPNVLVKYRGSPSLGDLRRKPTLFEVKPHAVLKDNWKKLRASYRAAIGWAREHDCLFHLVTDKQIRTTYLDNVKFLQRYHTNAIGEVPALAARRQDLVRETMMNLSESTPKELLAEITSDRRFAAELIPWIWNLIVCERIGVDLKQRLTMSSHIWYRKCAPVERTC